MGEMVAAVPIGLGSVPTAQMHEMWKSRGVAGMNIDTRPRRFFGLLCAHHWEEWGSLQLNYTNGTRKERLVLKCKHCGDMKYTPRPK